MEIRHERRRALPTHLKGHLGKDRGVRGWERGTSRRWIKDGGLDSKGDPCRKLFRLGRPGEGAAWIGQMHIPTKTSHGSGANPARVPNQV
ncbi:MAG TPA: hypothetical protein VGQ28_18035, partial [Thermoanaerobaculia bacterium]|nr:hypothetical protein [Thermoanaerobaculia bacterium]